MTVVDIHFHMLGEDWLSSLRKHGAPALAPVLLWRSSREVI